MNDIIQDIAASTIGQALIKQGKVEGKAEGWVSAVQVMWLERVRD